MKPEKRFRVLGPLEVEIDSRLVSIGGTKTRALLAMLLANRNRSVSADSLIETLWGDSAPATAAKSVQKYISQLRKDLDDALVTTDHGYLISATADEVDAARFESVVERATHLGPGDLEEALGLWRGDPYPELADTGSAAAETARLMELKMTAREMLIDSKLARGEHAETIGLIEGIAGANPYRERFWGQLMLALYRSGRQSEALDAYQRLRRTLGDELGIEPSPELKSLEERILLQDPDLNLVSRPLTNLPVPLTTFVGRVDEMNRIREWLGTARLVTVLGPAGSGKTRLATEVGKTLLSDFESSGVWFVDLAPVRSPDGVVEAIAKPLGISGGVDRHTESVLTEYLNDRRMVLILDNCEHLVARVAEVTDHMLRSSAKLVVIATSRERLGVDGEAVFDLAPLPYPAEGDEVSDGFDAVRLFNERARTSDPGYPSESEPKLIGEIVRRLDGIPLAIELAAARVRSLGLPGLRDRLDDRFKILTSAKRHGIDRHQTLVGAIDWSYLLLTADEQVLFTRLNVFRSSFNLEAAIDVCGFYPLSEDRVVDLLSELVDKSFVTTTLGHEGERRYFMLEMLREYGRRELDAAKAGHLRSQHAHYYCRFAEKAAGHLNGPAQGHWFHALSADHDNLRKALQWAATVEPSLAVRMSVALSQYWDSVGPRSEGHEWLRRSVEMSASLGAGERLNALLAASALFSSVHVSLPLRYAEDALVVARDIGDEMGQARALRALSWAHALEADTEKAVSSGLEALQMFEKLGDRWELAHCLERLGQANVADVTFSLEMLGRALDIYLEIGDKTREALLLYKIAERVADNAGDLSMARSYVERALAICDKLGNINDGAHARLEYGKILRRCGEYGSASAVLREALEQLTKSGDERCSVRALAALGVALIEGGESDEGIIALVESLRRGRDLEEGHTTRAAIAGLAGLIADAGDLKAGVTLFGFAEAIGREMGAPVSEASQERRQSRLNSLRDRLGSEVFDTAWDRGQVMQVENAVDLAVEAVNAG